jgi:hypothetical protein
VAVAAGHVLPECLGGGRGSPLGSACRGARELGLVVEHHDQVVMLGQRDLRLDCLHVRLVETSPAQSEEVILAQLQPDRVGTPVIRRRRDLLQVQWDEFPPVQHLQSGHRESVGDEDLTVPAKHPGAVDAERPGRLEARRTCCHRGGTRRGHVRSDGNHRGQRKRQTRRHTLPAEPPASARPSFRRHGTTSTRPPGSSLLSVVRRDRSAKFLHGRSFTGRRFVAANFSFDEVVGRLILMPGWANLLRRPAGNADRSAFPAERAASASGGLRHPPWMPGWREPRKAD